MKTLHKKLFVLAILIANCISTSAIEFTVDGVRYSVNNDSTTVTVAGYPSGSKPTGDLTIPESVTYGGISYPVTSIGGKAFYYCYGLTSVTIPNSVTSIGKGALENCSGLKSVTIPNSVTSIGNEVLSGCSGLTSIKVESGNSVYDSRENCNAIIETATNTLISGCKNTIIPNSVTEIGYRAFYDCSGLTSVTIPNSVTSIGDDAFFGCSGLTSVTIGNSVISIGYHAFGWCSGLMSIKVESGNSIYDSRENCNAIIETATNKLISGCNNTIIPNSVTSIGDRAFYGFTSLTSVTIPNSVTEIGNSAFWYCRGLTSVTIPNSVTSISNYAFYDCSGLTSVTIPNSVTSIGKCAFGSCSGLTSIKVESGNSVYDSRENCNAIIETATNTLITGCKNTTIIPNSVTSIGYYAFGYCSGLTSVTIPNSVTSIGEGAFKGCSKLSSINSLIQDPSVVALGTNVFSAENTCQLMVPAGTVDAYRAADQWKDFLNIKENIKVDATDFELTAEPSITTTAHQATPIVFSVMNPVDIKGIEFDIATSTWLNATGTVTVKTGAAEGSVGSVDFVSQPVFTLTEQFIGDEMDETKWMYLFDLTDLIEYPNMLYGTEAEKGLAGIVSIHMGEEVRTEEGFVVREYLEAGEGELFAINLYPLISGDHSINISNVKLTLVDGTEVKLDPFTINVKANRVSGDLNDDGVVDENDVPGGAKKYYNLAIDAGNIVAGEINTVTLMPISLHNTGDVTAFSCTVKLPERIQLVDDINTFVTSSERGENFTFTATQNQDGTITINGTATTPLEAGEGPVLNLKVKTAWQNTYTIPVTNITVTTDNGDIKQLPDSETRLVMQGVRGDMNGDGRVDLSDALYIINLATGQAE